ncbi:MAG: LPS export ABC transporter permease LptF [Acidobacteria bacterium]|nr:LPS export ABC transporter permease LptF [Acidobacteriota bacterium]
MRTLDRYVIREVLAPFALALLVLTFILIIPFIIAQAETMIAKGVPWMTVARVMVTLLPASLGLTIPMSLLVGLLIALGRLSGDREVAAMLACGLSPLRLMRPALVVGVLAWAATSYVMIWAIPDANQTFREITLRLVADRAEGEVKPRVFFEDFPGFVVYVRDVPMSGGWTGVLAADTRDPAHPVIYTADQGRMLVDRAQRTIQMVLTQGTRHTTSERDADGYEAVSFAETIVPLDPESVFPREGPARGEREMSIAELQGRVAELEAGGHSAHSPRIEIHKKFSIPAACLVFALLGVALGATYQRDGKFVGIARGLAVIFIYYALMWLGQALAQSGYLPPWLAMWLPNLVLGAAGVALMWRHLKPIRTRWSFRLPAFTWIQRARTAGANSGAWWSRVPDLPWLRPSLLDTYVGLLYFRMLALCLTGMAGLFSISTFIDLSDNRFKGTATTGMFLQYFWYATPQYLYYIIALAVLLAAIVTIGTLTKSSELIVMRACGISLYRTAVPLFVSAALASVALFAIEESVLGPANRRANDLVRRIRGQAPRSYDLLNRAWLTGRDGTVYHYQAYSPSEQELSGLTVLTFEDAESTNIATRTFARVAKAAPDASATKSWQARAGWTRAFAPDLKVREYLPFEERALVLEAPETFVTQAPPPSQMTYAQLQAYVRDLRASGYDVREDEVALYRKLAFPFVTIVMTLIGVPFAVSTGRRGALYGIGVGIVLALVYWTMISVTAAFGAGGAMAPMLAAWTPNLVFGACAVYLLLTVRT